jgi:two-component system response regulator VicR
MTLQDRSVLIVEDDQSIAEGLALNLKIDGYATELIDDGAVATERIVAVRPALVLLDISLPNKNGLDVLRELRAAGLDTPVIVLSARQEESDKVAALRLGADDYITKPFALAELLARVTAVLRRARRGGVPQAGGLRPDAPSRDPISFGELQVELTTHKVLRAGAEVALTHLEFELLAYFVRHPSQVFTREQLLRFVWGASAGSPRTVDNFVAQLRSKLEHDPEHPRHLVTVRGRGYRFDP